MNDGIQKPEDGYADRKPDAPHPVAEEPVRPFLSWNWLAPFFAAFFLFAPLAAILVVGGKDRIGLFVGGMACVALSILLPLAVVIGFGRSPRAAWNGLAAIGIATIGPLSLAWVPFSPWPGLVIALVVIAGLVVVILERPRDTTDVRARDPWPVRTILRSAALLALVAIAALSLWSLSCGVVCMVAPR